MASDATHGPLIAVLTWSGELMVKEGSLTAPWNDEYGSAEEVSVASDTASGPLIAVTNGTGEVLAKEGSLTAGWNDEWPDNAAYAVVASDPADGPLIGIVTEGTAVNPYENEAYVKEGSLSARMARRVRRRGAAHRGQRLGERPADRGHRYLR